jgi:thioester reductase-like protein
VTGGLGSELLIKLLESHPNYLIVTLIRAVDEVQLYNRLQGIFQYGDIDTKQQTKVYPILADICKPKLGVKDAIYDRLARNVHFIFHLAANVEFDISFESSYAVNVVSTEHILLFAKFAIQYGNLKRFNYVSTAYIAGDRRGSLKEKETFCGQNFHNGYEKSKLIAELKVEAEKQTLPITIYRPSMIVGSSKTGKTRKFFAFYDFLKILGLTSSRILLADPNARMDIVPSDYIADAMCYLSAQEFSNGNTYHLAAGLNRSLSVGKVLDTIFSKCELPKNFQKPEVIDENYFWKSANENELRRFKNSAMNLLIKVYSPYLSHERDFEVSKTMELLNSARIHLPSSTELLPTIVHYALAKKFKS